MQCRRCGATVPDEKRECQSCGEDNGYPNVRLAERPEEKSALATRLRDAEASALARHCKDVLDRFGTAILGSQAVIARALPIVQNLIESDQQTYTTFHNQLASGARVAEDNVFDRTRTQFEAALFPNFHHDIRFGFLALGAVGLQGYGAYAMVLKDQMIGHRTTVFEENPITLSSKLNIKLGGQFRPGYRAVWGDRGVLARAKLHRRIQRSTNDSEFPAILVEDRGGSGNSDFIEVHVFGPLNRHSIERIIGPSPKSREDRVIWRRLERQLKPLGIDLETI